HRVLRGWLERYAARVAVEPLSDGERRSRMDAVNPRYVPRNYLVQEVIEATARGDRAALPELLDVLRRPYDDQPGRERFAQKRPKAGVLLDLAGLAASSQGVRVRFGSAGKRAVIDGPFTEAKELIAGYWLIQVKSKEEAIEWAKRIPFEPDPKTGFEPEVEL